MPGSSHLWQPRRPPPGRGCFKGYITSREAVVARPCALCGRAQPTQNRVSRRRPNPAAPVLKWRFYMGMSRQESNSGEIRRLAEWPKVGPVAMRVPPRAGARGSGHRHAGSEGGHAAGAASADGACSHRHALRPDAGGEGCAAPGVHGMCPHDGRHAGCRPARGHPGPSRGGGCGACGLHAGAVAPLLGQPAPGAVLEGGAGGGPLGLGATTLLPRDPGAPAVGGGRRGRLAWPGSSASPTASGDARWPGR